MATAAKVQPGINAPAVQTAMLLFGQLSK